MKYRNLLLVPLIALLSSCNSNYLSFYSDQFPMRQENVFEFHVFNWREGYDPNKSSYVEYYVDFTVINISDSNKTFRVHKATYTETVKDNTCKMKSDVKRLKLAPGESQTIHFSAVTDYIAVLAPKYVFELRYNNVQFVYHCWPSLKYCCDPEPDYSEICVYSF